MPVRGVPRAVLATAGLVLALAGSCRAADNVLTLERKIALGPVAGRLDHLAVDIKRRRLFVAELGNDTLGVVDLTAGKLLTTIGGLHEPQGVGYEPSTDRVFVANAGDGAVTILSGDSLAPAGSVKVGADADNVRLDGPGRVMVGYTAAIGVLEGGKKKADLPLAAHPESFRPDPTSDRVFVNVPEAHHVAVIDRRTGEQLATWHAPGLGGNFAMAFDAVGKRLFVVYRAPAAIAVFDTVEGKLVDQRPTCGDVDDVFFDAKRRRVYLSCGEGLVGVLDASSSQLTELARLPTRQGARTALFVPELDRLFVAVRAEGANPAEIWAFSPSP